MPNSVDDYKRAGLLLLLGVNDVGQSVQDLEYDFYKGIVEGTLSLGGGGLEFPINRYVKIGYGSNTTFTPTLNEEYGVVIVSATAQTIDVGVDITTAGDASANVRLIVRPYTASTGQGENAISEAVVSASTTGTKFVTGVSITSGMYLFSVQANWPTTAPIWEAIASGGYHGPYGLVASLSSDVWPAGHSPSAGVDANNGWVSATTTTFVNNGTVNLSAPNFVVKRTA